MGAVWPTRPGGSKIRPIESCWNSAPPGLIVSAGESCDGRPPSLRASNSHAFAFVTSASPCSLPSSSTGPLLLSRHLCPDGFFYGAPYTDVVSIPFQSSAIWGVAGAGAGGYCDSCVGLWVYSSYDTATVVQQKLVTDGSIAEQTPAQGPTPYPVVTRSGRCVANGVSGTPYAAIIQ